MGLFDPTDPQQDAQPTQQPQSQPGPIKSFLSQFLYGAGQGLLAKEGLETDAQKQQRLANMQVQQANAQALNALRQQQTAVEANKAQTIDAGSLGKTLGIDLPPGQIPVGDLSKYLSPYFQGNSRVKAAETAAEARKSAAQTLADANYDIAKLKYGPAANGEPGGMLTHGFANVGDKFVMYDKRTGKTLATLGQANPSVNAVLRAQAQAKYGLIPTTDTEGASTSTSRLNAIENGIPVVPFAQARNIVSDRVGIQQYEDILNTKIAPNIGVLNDNAQRIAIAHTLQQADQNPGAIQSILTSALQQGTLTPQGAALAAGILQGREFGSVARKYGGNMNGTEGLMNRIVANQASPLNSEQLNRELIGNDLSFTKRAKASVNNLTRRGVPVGNAPANSPESSNDPFAKYGGRSR